jgi:DNA-binding NarL/FixJ family response regulator
MDNLMKNNQLMLISLKSFLEKNYAQFHADMTDNHGSFVDKKSLNLPVGRFYKIPTANAALTELLTSRETEVLNLLGTGLSIKGTAQRLVVSPGTVKWHVKNLYRKLGVTCREDALSKARLQKIIQ